MPWAACEAAQEKPAASPGTYPGAWVVQVNIGIMRTFVRLRQALAGHEELAGKLNELEVRCDHQFRAVFDAIRRLMAPPTPDRHPIGFTAAENLPRAF